MKSKGYETEVEDGNMFNMKIISVGIPDAGIMSIARDGNLYGDSLWGADVRTVDELLKKIEDFNPFHVLNGKRVNREQRCNQL